MDEMDEIKLPIGPEEVAEAAAILQKYKAGKAALDKRLVDNELWFRMGHWKNYQNPMMEGKPQTSSGWLFNSIANKHADAMDNYPAPNVLPRAADDEQTARVLSSILPVVLEQADYEQVYSDTWWRKLKQGTGVKGIFWDPEQHGGVGEIAIRPMNLLMLYWEPGVEDIQASPHFFSLNMENTKQLEARWPQLKGHSASVLDVPRFIHDGGLDTSEKSVVVDWYYKSRMRMAGCCSTTASSATAWSSTPARTTRRWPGGASTTTASIPSCSTRSSWRRTARRASGTST